MFEREIFQSSLTHVPLQLPEWLVHGASVGVSSNLIFFMMLMAGTLVVMLSIYLVLDQCSREQPLKAKLGALEQQLFRVHNEAKIMKREAEEALKNGGIVPAPVSAPIVSNEVPENFLKDMESLKVSDDVV